tara:strand:- start:1427 stop:1813 length:387 start_codon:yes stop_codon:yes gene_type:complete
MKKSILAGVIGTAIMTVFMMIAPMMGMPKMSPPNMLSGMLSAPLIVGWIMHFVIGIVFAYGYIHYVSAKLKFKNIYVKGAVFGIIVFVLAQIMMAIMAAPMGGSMALNVSGSLLGHIVFGIAVAKAAK